MASHLLKRCMQMGFCIMWLLVYCVLVSTYDDQNYKCSYTQMTMYPLIFCPIYP